MKMKKIFFIGIIFVSFISCDKNISDDLFITNTKDSVYISLPSSELIDSLPNITCGGNQISGSLKSATSLDNTDWSGLVKVKYYSVTTAPAFQHNDNWTYSVDDDYLCIGGGVRPITTGAGAFVVDSRPLTDFSGWLVSTKDHQQADQHVIFIFAVGLKIEGVSKEELKSRLRIFTSTSPEAHHPHAEVTIPSNYDLIGGGADINYDGAGCLLTHSYPVPGQSKWIAEGKDHFISDPSTITAYAIGIEKGYIPGFGYLDVSLSSASQYVSYGLSFAQASTTSGWVSVCPGGRSEYSNEGRLIRLIEPIATVATVDKNARDSGTTYAYNLMLRKQP